MTHIIVLDELDSIRSIIKRQHDVTLEAGVVGVFEHALRRIYEQGYLDGKKYQKEDTIAKLGLA